jgi:N-acetylmuramoyl-L-alanine amidase
VKICLDAGHGGNDPGAIGPSGLLERAVNLGVVTDTAKLLSAMSDMEVIMTRETDVFLSLPDRSQFANDHRADLFISVHCNSAAVNTATGTETFAFRAGGDADRLAQAIQRCLVDELQLRNRGVKYDNFAVLRDTRMPAALVEIGFINNPDEEAKLRDRTFQLKAANGIANGVAEFLGKRRD